MSSQEACCPLRSSRTAGPGKRTQTWQGGRGRRRGRRTTGRRRLLRLQGHLPRGPEPHLPRRTMPSASPREGSGSPDCKCFRYRGTAWFAIVWFFVFFFFFRIFAVRFSWKWEEKLTWFRAEHALVLSTILKFLISRRLVRDSSSHFRISGWQDRRLCKASHFFFKHVYSHAQTASCFRIFF